MTLHPVDTYITLYAVVGTFKPDLSGDQEKEVWVCGPLKSISSCVTPPFPSRF